MKMRKTFSVVLALMLVMTTLFTMGFALGDDQEAITDYVSKNVSVSGETVTITNTALRGVLTSDEKQADDAAEAIVTVNGQPLYLKKGKTADNLIDVYQRSVNNDKTNNAVTVMGKGLGIEADVGAAADMLSGFTPVLSMLLGVIVTLITVFMTVFSAFDIAYIAFPVFRNKCEDAKVNGGAMAKTKSNGETSLRFVTDDAQYAVQQGSVESGKSPWTIYFKKRIMSYIMLAIILFILMTGNITLITNIAVNLVAGIMNVLGGLAA